MSDGRGFKRVEIIGKKIRYIQSIVEKFGGIKAALADEESGRAAILMHLTSIAEQFDKLIKNGEFDLLSRFDREDIKGSYDLRTFIAHDDEGVDLYIVEEVIRRRLPVIAERVEEILSRRISP